MHVGQKAINLVALVACRQIHSTVECLAHISFRALNAATFLKVSGLQHLLYKATMKRIFENVAMSHTYHSWR